MTQEYFFPEATQNLHQVIWYLDTNLLIKFSITCLQNCGDICRDIFGNIWKHIGLQCK